MRLSEISALVMALAPDADRYNANPATDVVNLAEMNRMAFVVMEGAGGTGTVKIQVESCDNAAGANNVAIPFNYRLAASGDTFAAPVAAAAAGYTTVAGATKMILVEIQAVELLDGQSWARLQLTEVVDSPCDAAVLAIGSDPRYAEQVMPTVIA